MQTIIKIPFFIIKNAQELFKKHLKKWQIKEGIFSWKQFLRQIYLKRKWKPRNQAQMETKGVWNICLEENFDVMWHDRKQNVNMMKVLSRKKISKYLQTKQLISFGHMSAVSSQRCTVWMHHWIRNHNKT